MAKWDKHRKRERDKLVREYRRAHPELSLTEIGAIFGVSYQRIQQILAKEVKDGTT